MSEEEIKLNELKAAILDAEVAWAKAKESFDKALSMQKELLSSTKKIDEIVAEDTNELEAPVETVETPVEEVVETPVEAVEAPAEEVVEAPVEAVEAPAEEVVETPVEAVEAPAEEVVETPVEAVEAPAEEVVEAPAEAVEAPAEEVVEAPVEAVEAPAEEVVEAPAEAVEAPAEEVVEAPVEAVEAPAEEVVEAPAETVETPAEEVVEAPVEAVEAPAEEVVETPAVPIVNIPMEPVEEQVKAPITPTVSVAEDNKEAVIDDSNIVLPVLNGAENETTIEQSNSIESAATTEVNKVTFKKEYNNTDKAILVNEGQLGKLKSSKDEQKELMNYINTNVSGVAKPVVSTNDTNDLEAMMAQVEEAKAKGDMAEAERLLNQVSEINESKQLTKTA